jgi:hypothetical protein
MLKTSAVTEQMKKEQIIYHLARTGNTGIDALGAALSGATVADGDRYHPFSKEYRIPIEIPDPIHPNVLKLNPYFACIKRFVNELYDDSRMAWRQVDHDWLGGVEQLALDLDNDTNNTSLVLAFEFSDGRERDVLLFMADAQIGSWQSLAKLGFKVPGRLDMLPAHELLRRTVFYKVGHHCSHNATLRNGGLELMNRDDLVAFIPVDRATAKKQGSKGWDMPATPLFNALKAKTSGRVVLSDATEPVPPEVIRAGVSFTPTYIDYFLL